MAFQLSFLDISVWFAFVSLVLLLTTEVVSQFGSAQGLLLNKARLRLLAAITSLLLVAIIVLRAYQILKP